MLVSILKHISYEEPGYFIPLFNIIEAEINIVELYNGDDPELHNPDVIVVMGGPMNIYEEDKYPWLVNEKQYLKKMISEDKVIIGVCLGAQLLADSLGAKVYKNDVDEIGWFTIRKEAKNYLDFLPDFATVLHWHGDTFDLPSGALNLYSSSVTKNQAFIFKKNILALQFHLEMTPEIVNDLYNDISELIHSETVMSVDQIVEEYQKYAYSNQRILRNLVNYILSDNGLLKN